MGHFTSKAPRNSLLSFMVPKCRKRPILDQQCTVFAKWYVFHAYTHNPLQVWLNKLSVFFRGKSGLTRVGFFSEAFRACFPGKLADLQSVQYISREVAALPQTSHISIVRPLVSSHICHRQHPPHTLVAYKGISSTKVDLHKKGPCTGRRISEFCGKPGEFVLVHK